mmetsp:Transcript_4463/g.5172  ORF Transcript_4463/g.5172 Transcript_4463/m.5172 type:complete len:478 (-) Transcript_4463:53-1486(-)|eukprot:CAMPEP_0194145636 /NCGR_PEP_ID=MMETSP0152-20130528/18006_1 /TAXON_ID=1049557 /ORGANISM="Thalassiothrix antarctica, Strain L6-D1" /LENGTH=477 /DNA_ID=CAMNT_0038845917 /DNA_START=27 /DNA_END=1460 /DNA_ORIENTATION=+
MRFFNAVLCYAIRLSLIVAFTAFPQEIRSSITYSSFGSPLTRIGIKSDASDDELDDDEKAGEGDDNIDEKKKDNYQKTASSEFSETDADSSASLALSRSEVGTTNLDWGGEYGKLSERMDVVKSGGERPSQALFRVMASETPNQAISNFLKTANPQVVGAMSGAVSSLLGGLSNPSIGMETIVRTTGDKIGNLCFQLQMTGYMFRNAEYVMALKDLLNIKGGATLEDYREAFEKLDRDGSGYIDTNEIEVLLTDVYDGAVPGFEIDAFMNFFDTNHDGKISWEEFEKGLGNLTEKEAKDALKNVLELPAKDEEKNTSELETTVTGMIEIELDDGKVIEVEASDYMESLRKEAEDLKKALRVEMGGDKKINAAPENSAIPSAPQGQAMNDGITGYIASRRNDLQEITNSIQPEIMETMRLLVDFVLEGGNPRNKGKPKENLKMEVPGAALQQLALWQLVLGYKLREMEATGEYLKLLE